MAGLLLAWFDEQAITAAARPMPWRQVRDPYRVLLSEVMLQQTQVATVIPYYENFLAIWPTIADLATADEQVLLKAWEGLGYYSRARNLQAAARQIVAEHGGMIPSSEAELKNLKGIGDYTAGAIRSIAFNLPAAAVDGNVVRVAARLTCTPWDPTDLKQRREVKAYILSVQPADRPGDFNEALMDLGATVCLPKSPRCSDCPLQQICQAYGTRTTTEFPVKKSRAPVPIEQRICLIYCRDRQVLVQRRPDRGLLAGLYEFSWAVDDWSTEADIASSRPASQCSIRYLGEKRHVFTHRIWQMRAFLINLPDSAWPGQVEGPFGDTTAPDETAHGTTSAIALDEAAGGRWVDAEQLAELPFPTALANWRDEVIVALSQPC